MNEVYIHPHALKHGISEEEIKDAWENFVAKTKRPTPKDDQILCVGFSKKRQRQYKWLQLKIKTALWFFTQ